MIVAEKFSPKGGNAIRSQDLWRVAMTAYARQQTREPSASRYPEPIPLPPSDPDTIDYWEEVDLARLRLARLALIVTLAGTAILGLILM